MARVNRRPKRKATAFTKWHLQQLRHGHDYPCLPGFRDDLEAMREAWEIFRDEILHDWIREDPGNDGRRDGGPGTRPWAWWQFDAPELRQRIDGKVHPFENPDRIKLVEERERKYPGFAASANKAYFGGLGSLVWPDDFAAVFESEAAFLLRLELLLPGEAEMIEALQVLEEETEDKHK